MKRRWPDVPDYCRAVVQMSGGNILASGIGDVDDRFFNRIFVDGQRI
jgi:hypothetical protein